MNFWQFVTGKANRNSAAICSTEKIPTGEVEKYRIDAGKWNFSSFLNFQTKAKNKSSVPKLSGFFGWNSSKILIRPILGADIEWESGLFSNFMQSFSNLWVYLLNLTSQKNSFVRKMAPPAVTIHLKLQ